VHQIELEMQNEELVQARGEREALLRKYTDLYDLAPVGHFTLALDGGIRQVNLFGANLLGLARSDLIERRFGVFVSAPSRTTFNTFLEDVFGSQLKGTCEVELQKDGAAPDWVHMEAVRNEDGYDCRAVVSEITKRKRAEEALKVSLSELERSNLELEQFAYAASHDLQEPLRMVSSYTQLLALRYSDQLDQDAHDFIGYAVDGANRMQRMIQDLLTFSRISTLDRRRETVDLNQAMAEAVGNLQAAIDESAAGVSSGGLPTVTGDQLQLVQVFQNLIANAIKFRKKDEPPRVHVSARRQADEWIISVKDNGIGIDPRHFRRLFVVFQRLHGLKEYPGTGLGLALCQRVITRLGGRIWVESALGQGSEFFFALTAGHPPLPSTGALT
jgi:chemotaxis family two-component system sensor kinase Cph1